VIISSCGETMKKELEEKMKEWKNIGKTDNEIT